MKAEFKTITPAIAKDLLDHHNKSNRKLRPSYVQKLADEMAAGRWQDHHQAIGFDKDGDVIDGQHRLAAVVASGKPQRFLVVHAVPTEAIGVIDSHSHRSTKDALRLVHGIEASDRAVSCAMYVDSRGALVRKLPAERIECFLKHKKLVERAERIFDTNLPGVCRGNIMAVVARALATHSAAEVAPFCEVLVTGASHKARDQIVIKLRDHLMLKTAGHGSKGSAHATAYLRAEYALDAWLQNKPVTNLREAKTELFPLPGEKKLLAKIAKAAEAAEAAA